MEFGDISTINSILIANRGEISARVSRTCRKMGIRSVAVYSDADSNLPYVKEADEAIHIGPSNPADSYLAIDKIISAAKITKVDAVHPGYGFLSENADFARRCHEEGLIFIGPHPEAIDAMGSKSKAKDIMIKNKVPTVPGYQGKDQSKDRLIIEAKKIGFPLLLKATAGGGGKGMRIVHSSDQLDKAIDAAKRESLNAFGDDELIIEKYVESGRHIEFQIFGDRHGNYIHILERECTIQRRYQKVVEESPSPIMTPELRASMGEAAVNAAKAIKYDNAGTVEFIFDDRTGEFYFLEVNTRLQVEHPVTEEITGLDLVQLQIQCAQGKSLPIKQDDVSAQGYAIEVRLYAEDPYNDFNPVTGRILKLSYPMVEGLRVDTAVKSGSEISMYYDPMISKLIVVAADRATAHRKLSYVLKNMTCAGMVTNQDFLLQIIDHDNFRKGDYDTHFINDFIAIDKAPPIDQNELVLALIAITCYDWYNRNHQRTLLKSMPSGWRNSFYEHQFVLYQLEDEKYPVKYKYLRENKLEFIIDDNVLNVAIATVGSDEICIEVDGLRRSFSIVNDLHKAYIHTPHIGNIVVRKLPRLPHKEVEQQTGGYIAPMPAQVVKVLVVDGQTVEKGDSLLVISSMKMESTIEADESGVVDEVYVSDNQVIEAGFLMLKMKD